MPSRTKAKDDVASDENKSATQNAQHEHSATIDRVPPPPRKLRLWGTSPTSSKKPLLEIKENGGRRRAGDTSKGRQQGDRKGQGILPRLLAVLALAVALFGGYTYVVPRTHHTSATSTVRAGYKDVLWQPALFNVGQWALDRLEWVVRKLTPPHLALLRLGGRWMESVVAHLVVRLEVCDIIGNTTNWITVEKLSSEIISRSQNMTSIETDKLRRVLLAAVQLDLLKRRTTHTEGESEGKGREEFSLSSLGEYLKVDHPRSARPAVYFLSGLEGMEAWHSIYESIQTGQSGFREIHGEEKFEHMTKNHQDWKVFDEAQASLNRDSLPAVFGEYGLQAPGENSETAKFVFCDIGGGEGITLAEVLRAYPSSKGYLLDQSHPVATATARMKELGFSDRGIPVVGDFFKQLPSQFKECDYFHMRWILHDWGDDKSHTILSTIVDSASERIQAGKNVKIVLTEAVLGTQLPIFESNKHLMDISMLAWHEDAKERTLDEYDTLLKRVGFRRSAFVPTQSILTVIEYVPDEPLIEKIKGVKCSSGTCKATTAL